MESDMKEKASNMEVALRAQAWGSYYEGTGPRPDDGDFDKEAAISVKGVMLRSLIIVVLALAIAGVVLLGMIASGELVFR